MTQFHSYHSPCVRSLQEHTRLRDAINCQRQTSRAKTTLMKLLHKFHRKQAEQVSEGEDANSVYEMFIEPVDEGCCSCALLWLHD